MTSWLKWLIGIGILAGIIVVYSVMNLQSKSNHLTTQEVEIILESALIGELRQGNFEGVSKKELIGNLIAEITQTQKNIDTPIRIDYAFLDKNNKVTEVEEDITQLQFQVSLMDRKNKKVQSTTAKRIVLDVTIK